MKRIHTSLAIAIAVTLMLAGGIAQAEVPTTIAYQGRITDAAGDPVVDGNYLCDFRLYDAAVGGALIWEEPAIIVTTVDGLFSTSLGSTVPFPQNPGSVFLGTFGGRDTLWLEIEVAGEIQSPRTRLHSTPYAMAARNLSGWALSDPNVGIETNSDIASLTTYGYTGGEKARLWGPSYGEIFLRGGGDLLSVILAANFGNDGSLTLFSDDHSDQIALRVGTVGDASAILRDDAINADEMFNEPGIALSTTTTAKTLVATDNGQDITSVSITIPTSGYIIVEGEFYHRIDDTATAYGWVQISETSGATATFGGSGFNWTGSSDLGNNLASSIYFTTPVRMAYFKSAGTYTFYMVGNMYRLNDTDVDAFARPGSWLQATYYPTSYGAVQTIAANPGDNPDATAVQIEDDVTGSTTAAYSMDLRYYELKAKEARKAALEAELELERARRQAAIESGQQASSAQQ